MRKILITGASGFIGFETVLEFIKNGCFVYALTHNTIKKELLELEKNGKIKIAKGDVTNYETLEKTISSIKDIDAIIHCAGWASDVGSRKNFYNINYVSVENLTRITSKYNIKRFVFVSTTDVYGLKDFNGEDEEQLSYDEKTKSPYPYYKILAEKYIIKNLNKEKYSIVRPAAVYGDGDLTITNRVVSFLKFSPFIIHFGKWKGKNRWPMVDVKKVANANYLAAFHDDAKGLAINVIDDEFISIDNFYRTIASKYLPNRTYKSITLPFWLGYIYGFTISFISNLLRLKKPFADPSLYALYSVSKNLDFSSKRYKDLRKSIR